MMTNYQWSIIAPFIVLLSYIFTQLMLTVLASQRERTVSVHDRIRAAKRMRIQYLDGVKSQMEAFNVEVVDDDDSAQEGIEITDEAQLESLQRQKKQHAGKQARLAQMNKGQPSQPRQASAAEPVTADEQAIQEQIDADPSINVDIVPEAETAAA